ncbi:MAG: class I SAM-dependent methyltransferase [Acidimicrobiales bacterium]
MIYQDDYLTADGQYGIDTMDLIVAAIGHAAALRRFEIIERHIGVGTVLDVGCGSGEGLVAARDRGWEGVGVEPVKASADRARERGFDVRASSLDDADLPRHAFDVVVAAHVLEHMLRPVELLASMVRHARPGGLIVVEVPNWNHPERRARGRDWEHLRPNEHAMHFTPTTLRRTMERAGLKPDVRTETVVERKPVMDRIGLGFAVVATASV